VHVDTYEEKGNFGAAAAARPTLPFFFVYFSRLYTIISPDNISRFRLSRKTSRIVIGRRRLLSSNDVKWKISFRGKLKRNGNVLFVKKKK
jgi:hypothetical protein